jgi:peptidoglycan/xylan/chitin deacetylase (PgdA/CDA1 family)
MGSGFARIVFLVAVGLSAGLTAATAGACPGNPNAIGTSRTIVVDPREHLRIGTMDYAETLPLVDREVVLTFDDGPLPPFTTKVLDILAAQCVHATYFMVGDMAKQFPALARSVYDAGHTIGTHSMTHPFRFRKLSVERGNAEIDNGIAAVAAALGDPDRVAPFFRFPGFGHTEPAQEHAASRGLMVWGADVPADDWHKLGPREVARRAVQRLERKGKGILLLHDIHQRTVDALPFIFEELKARGFRIVHVVPASPDRAVTVTAALDWLPTSRPSRVAAEVPVILLADVLDPEGDVAKKSAEALCSLNPPRETVMGRISGHRHHRRMTRSTVRMAKYGQAKAKTPGFADFNAGAAGQQDIHAVAQ